MPIRRLFHRVVRALRRPDPTAGFGELRYQRLNHRRLEHLASLGLDVAGRSVLEVGAGPGDLTHFFIDRDCRVTTSDGRRNNLAALAARYPGKTRLLDLEHPDRLLTDTFDIVFAYGILYHLSDPTLALAYLSARCGDLMLIETCVTPGAGEELHPVPEKASSAGQSIHGTGCRPTRAWFLRRLVQHFAHVYVPVTQPWHEQFPLDWTRAAPEKLLTRSIFIASRRPIDNPLLATALTDHQRRH